MTLFGCPFMSCWTVKAANKGAWNILTPSFATFSIFSPSAFVTGGGSVVVVVAGVIGLVIDFSDAFFFGFSSFFSASILESMLRGETMLSDLSEKELTGSGVLPNLIWTWSSFVGFGGVKVVRGREMIIVLIISFSSDLSPSIEKEWTLIIAGLLVTSSISSLVIVVVSSLDSVLSSPSKLLSASSNAFLNFGLIVTDVVVVSDGVVVGGDWFIAANVQDRSAMQYMPINCDEKREVKEE